MEMMDKYARLLIKTGVNIQQGQTLVLSCPIECSDFAHRVQKQAYQAGAREVVIRWGDEKSARITYDLAPSEIFDEFPAWSKTFYDDYAAKGAAFLTILATDPDMMKGVDPSRISRQAKARGTALEAYRSAQMSNKHTWCVASVPTRAWAQKVFPGMAEPLAVEALWQAILTAVRVDQHDPVDAWHRHQEALDVRVKFLNDARFAALRYRNAIGTDLTVKLPDNHIWFGGGDECAKGYVFMANLPTEEVFTAPQCRGANGRLVSSMPLNHNGNLIEDFWFSFKDGVVVDYGARQGLSTLKELLATDEGARMLGEVALVPHDSPISNQGIPFYNTLFDENASCHFALGKAYPTCVQGGTDMDKEQLAAAGVNDSLIHVDFMVGSADLAITGIQKDGSELPVFIDGNFVIR
ncbi:MAG: peptidase M29 [Spirochaetes bacterium RIFOXYC1_FULL_54_7]|nr:MAG: peptidase M29 [Spirochaetes bacterium RIFOXYC1_FULL_54_7]